MPSYSITLTLDAPLAGEAVHDIGGQVASDIDAYLVTTGIDEERRAFLTLAHRGGPANPDTLRAVVHAIVDRFAAAGHRVSTIEHIDSMTEAEVDRRIAALATPELLGTTEFCELLGVTRQGLYHLRDTDPSFPAQIGRGVWLAHIARSYATERTQRRDM